MDIGTVFRLARVKSGEGIKWATQAVRLLEAKQSGLGVEWALVVFDHFIHLECFKTEHEAQRLYRETIEIRRKLTSVDELRAIWSLHEKNALEKAVLRLWTALSFPSVDDAGAGVELIFDDSRLDMIAREAPLLLLHDYLKR